MFFPLTPVVKNLIILNALMFFGTMLLPTETRLSLSLGYFQNEEIFEPYQLVTHFFMHQDLSHLFFNMIGLYFFGAKLEMIIGAQRFLKLFFVSALGAVVLSVGVDYLLLQYALEGEKMTQASMIYWGRSWGASGGLYGVIAGAAVAFGNDTFRLLIPPIPVKVKYLALFYVGISIFGAFGPSDGIGHLAHLGGALFGFLIMQYWRRS